MASHRFLAAVVLVSVFFAGCAGNMRVKIDPSNPVYQPKNDFEVNYGFFITPDERKVGYTVEMFPTLPEPIRPFDEIDTLDEFLKFEKHFWNIRDTDPNTPQNEYKELIDGRLQNIRNEIFRTDLDIPGTSFSSNGGLKGDLARVYLLWGAPTPRNKFKFSGNYLDLMVWYYFDSRGRPLMRFLFYNKHGRLELFREHNALIDWAYVLQRISKRPITSEEDLQMAWEELEQNDINWAFRAAIMEFSYYTKIDKDTQWTVDVALAPPEPAALTARRLKPAILGQPDDLTGREFISSPYRSFIPSKLKITEGGRPSFSLAVSYSNVDWEVKGENAETILDLRISFQHKTSRKLTEFEARLPIPKTREEVEKKRKGVVVGNVIVPVIINIDLDDIYNFVEMEETRQTLRQLIDGLEPGEYVVNGDLRHAVTKKYNAWREEILISQ